MGLARFLPDSQSGAQKRLVLRQKNLFCTGRALAQKARQGLPHQGRGRRAQRLGQPVDRGQRRRSDPTLEHRDGHRVQVGAFGKLPLGQASTVPGGSEFVREWHGRPPLRRRR